MDMNIIKQRLKTGIVSLLTLNMVLSNSLMDYGFLNVSASTTETGASESVKYHDPALPQNERYRTSIPAGQDMLLEDIIVMSGMLKQEDVADYVSHITEISVSDDQIISVKKENDQYFVSAGSNFTEEAVLVLRTDDGSEVYLTVTDSAYEPVATIIAAGSDGLEHTGSLSVRKADGTPFAEGVSVFADVTHNEASIEALTNNHAIHADYLTFYAGIDEASDSGYEVNLVLPEPVAGEDYRLFHIYGSDSDEVIGSVDITNVNGEEGVAGIHFQTQELGDFVLAFTKQFNYDVQGTSYNYTVTEDGSIHLGDLLINAGVVDRAHAKMFISRVDTVESSSIEELDVTAQGEDCTLVPARSFEEVLVTVTMIDGQSFTVTVADGRDVNLSTISSANGYYEVSVTYDADANIPEGSQLNLKEVPNYTNTGKELSHQAVDALSIPAEDVALVSLFDASIEHEGETISPQTPVDLKVEVNKLEHVYDAKVVSLGEINEVLNASEKDVSTRHEIVASNLDSVYAVVLTKLTKELTASDGNTYRITASFDRKNAGIPENAQLAVYEINESQEEYKKYVSQSTEKTGESADNVVLARAFDISFRNPETMEEYHPTGEVQVSIDLISSALDNLKKVDVVHIHGDDNEIADVIDSNVKGESVEFTADGFSVYVVLGYSVDFDWDDHIYTVTEPETVLLSELLRGLDISDITVAQITNVTFSNSSYATVTKITDSDTQETTDWSITFTDSHFTSEESLTLTLSDQTERVIKVTGKETYIITPPSPVENLVYNGEEQALVTAGTVADGAVMKYSLDAEGEFNETIPVGIDAGTYTVYYRAETADGEIQETGSVDAIIERAPVVLTAIETWRNYDGKEKTNTGYTASLNGEVIEGLEFNNVYINGSGTDVGEYEITFTVNDPADSTGNYTVADTVPGTLHIANLLEKEMLGLEGNWATWKITVNTDENQINKGEPLTLRDTFTDNQSIDYSSIQATEGVTYDYRGYTGTYVIPDATSAEITYRTRIIAQPGENKEFGNTASLTGADEQIIGEVTTDETHVIYPSSSEASDTEGDYLMKLFVYGDSAMQTGISGAEFQLLDLNKRPMTYRSGDDAGQPVTFTTDENGYATVRIDEEPNEIRIEKNTPYSLEMIKAPDGYRMNTSQYSFTIKDDPDYSANEYYNGDTLKVRLSPESAGLTVTMRFSGNYALTDEQKDKIKVNLSKQNGQTWDIVESHTFSEFSYGSFVFTTPLEENAGYRVELDTDSLPWDIPTSVNRHTAYSFIVGSEESLSFEDMVEFVADGNKLSSSLNVIINNEFEEHKLTITTMDKETGDVLPGAVFTVKKASDDSEVTRQTSDAQGMVEISGGEEYQSDTLYYIAETDAPENYLLPLEAETYYFYFCTDPELIPEILADLPEGKTAINLSETYGNVTVDNQKELRTIPVMKIWQGNTWPEGVSSVVIGLYQSVGGAEPTPVTIEGNSEPLTVTLSKTSPYNNKAFTGLPSRNSDNQTITYSIKEEHVYNSSQDDIISQYVQEYGISDSGIFIVRNKDAASLTVVKEWYDAQGNRITDSAQLAQQPQVYFDIYRSTQMYEGSEAAHDAMKDFVGGLTKVLENVTIGNDADWTRTVSDLDDHDDSGNVYYYYVMENVPSFGDETYVLDESAKKITVRNKVAPEAVKLTVTKAALVDDPREESKDTEFEFTLKLAKGENVIRNYTVFNDGTTTITTDWNGEAKFKLKPEHNIDLSVPIGVTATVTESLNPEFDATSAGPGGSSGRSHTYEIKQDASVTFTNTLRVICKVVDKNNEEIPFESFKSAFAYIRDHKDEVTVGDVITIQMLGDYTMPVSDVFEVRENENIVLTTAATADVAPTEKFHFYTERTEDTARAYITNGSGKCAIVKNSGTLTLRNVLLDGSKNTFTPTGDGGLVHNAGALNLETDTTLQNSKIKGKGGAIYSTGTINMTGGSITGNGATNGSAVYLADGTMNMTGGSIEGNNVADGGDGAVVASSSSCRINVSGSVRITDNTKGNGTNTTAANLFINADGDILDVLNPGLSEDALIGVTAPTGHKEIGEQFAMVEAGYSSNLNHFVNDTSEYRGKLKEGSSTGVVWNGLTLSINKVFPETAKGGNPNDVFTITLTSASIKKSNYTISGVFDYTITPARGKTPGVIVLRGVKQNTNIQISPLPSGTFTISEAVSNYSSEITATDEAGKPLPIAEGKFTAQGDCTVTVASRRNLAGMKLIKFLSDRSTSDSVSFPFTVKLTDSDGTSIAGYQLADNYVTNGNGEAEISLSPSNSNPAVLIFDAPIGSKVSITETESENSRYRVNASGVTKDGESIENEDKVHSNVFVFPVSTETDGAEITFANQLKMTEIELRKEIVNKVSAGESSDFTLTLTKDGSPIANYPVYIDESDPSNNITTDPNGTANFSLSCAKGEDFKSIMMGIPEGASLSITEVEKTKTIGDQNLVIYDTVNIVDGRQTTGNTVSIASVTDNNKSIIFRNMRKTKQITVTNTVGGYSGNKDTFTFVATVDGEDEKSPDYNSYGFNNGTLEFELATGQTKSLTVPYGAHVTIGERFIIGYEPVITVTHPKKDEEHPEWKEILPENQWSYAFDVTEQLRVDFKNNQLIKIVLDNKTTQALNNVVIEVTDFATKMYKLNSTKDNQESVDFKDHQATVSLIAGEKAFFMLDHNGDKIEFEQNYTVSGSGPSEGYYYTIKNEPSYHEYANPAVQRIYDTSSFLVSGKLRYSTIDSIITFTEEPLVSFDSNGGVWTTEMDGYRDRDGNRKVYQINVESGTRVSAPSKAPVYPISQNVKLLGWTTDEAFAKSAHREDEDISSKAYDFNQIVNTPITLYAVWATDPSVRCVTVKNALNNYVSAVITLEDKNGNPIKGHSISDDVTTDDNGKATININTNENKNLSVPNESKLIIQGNQGIAYSPNFTDEDTQPSSFTISSVINSGTVSFIAGVCKITDGNGNVLYDNNGNPAVYSKLSDAFSAYSGSFRNGAIPSYVKMLVDDYDIQQGTALEFPDKAMTLTTAGINDSSFPYAGTRTCSTIFRYRNGNSKSCFSINNANSNITLTNIILDGGSELTRKAETETNGGLINVSNGTLNVTTGTVMRNNAINGYSNENWGRGGAIYMSNGTVNVEAGQFKNLQARRGGAIAADKGTLNITGTNGSIRFEDCVTNTDSDKQYGGDGGAICFISSGNITIDGGESQDNPGIVFARCRATTAYGDGGAVFACTNYDGTVIVKGSSFIECSAYNDRGADTGGFGGGGINAYHVKRLEVRNSTFTNCDSLRGGGAVMTMVKTTTVQKSNDEIPANNAVYIDNCIFEACNCKSQGGAIGVYQDNNGDTSSTTELRIANSEFKNCSSGTKNGSGGAIQSYVPCMEFNNVDFTDCWAGKEGGAINNWYGANDSAMWGNSYVYVIDCNFVRCRAEDRYELTGKVHFGGGIATKTVNLQITNSNFTDCVSTLKQGGAVHCSGIGKGTTTTVTGGIFDGCSAKSNGGALMTSTETLTITGAEFKNCDSFAENGGAIYHGNSVNTAGRQEYTSLTNCTIDSNSAAKNGGALWSQATNASITNCKINNCVAGSDGGAIYREYTTVERTKEDGEKKSVWGDTTTSIVKVTGDDVPGDDAYITNCRANYGSAIYAIERTYEWQQGDIKTKETPANQVTLSGVRVTGNQVNHIDSGAIHARTQNYEGNTVVKDNTCSADPSVMHDAVIYANSNNFINTTNERLLDYAEIGVYTKVGDPYNKHGKVGQPFGTYGDQNGNVNLKAFFNDRDKDLHGFQLSAESKNIYWRKPICKITDEDGNTLKRFNGTDDAVYSELTDALSEFSSIHGAVYIKMLVENYTVSSTKAIHLPNAQKIRLTTAGETDEDYPYKGTPGTYCTIYSDINGDQTTFVLGDKQSELTLENITLDGRKDSSSKCTERMVWIDQGKLIINGGTTIQNCWGTENKQSEKQNGGGAVYAKNNSSVIINGKADEDGNPTVKFLNCSAQGDSNGGAICTNNLVINNLSSEGYGTAFYNCGAARGGAIVVNETSETNINGVIFRNCVCKYEGGAVYHNSNKNGTTNIERCQFISCNTGTVPAYPGNTWSYGGGITSVASDLVVKNSIFTDCHALSDGGAVNHGADKGNKNSTILENNVFTNCTTTGTNGNFSYGGAVFTRGKDTALKLCTFTSCESTNNGGAVYTSNSDKSSLNVTGTSFESCQTSKANGLGGAIATNAKTVNIGNEEDNATSFVNCLAKGQSGAVHMVSSGSTLNVSGETLVNQCSANSGGAFYLQSGVIMNLTGIPEFTKNGYSTGNAAYNSTKGANIYLSEGSKLNISGSPKFNRNILGSTEKVINGGISDNIRQDIYMAGYSGKVAASINVTGELTGDTIWVWPEKAPHRLASEQFATKANSVTAASLSKFRNALDDGETGCTHGEYLAGVPGNESNVNWNKMYDVSFRKIDNKSIPVIGAEFTLYTDKDCTKVYATSKSADGEKDTGAKGEILEKGIVDFSAVTIGTYYMKETDVPVSYESENKVYLVLVGTPALSPNETNQDIWKNNGPLDFEGAENAVERLTTSNDKFFGIFELKDNGKADVSKNLASAASGISNNRLDFPVWFMKTDSAGNELPNAEFTLYSQKKDKDGNPMYLSNGYPIIEPWSHDGETYPDPAVSADGTSEYKDIEGKTLPKGLVYFPEVPKGILYLLETDYPERNGSNRREFYVESDRLFRIEVRDENDFTLSEWKGGSQDNYAECSKDSNYYIISNTEAVCKITDGSDKLLYLLGSDGKTRRPALYPSLKDGFSAAQSVTFYDANGTAVTSTSEVKIKLLKDISLAEDINQNGSRPVTLTTAERTAASDGDRYIFVTNRTSDTSRAEITRGYNINTKDSGLINVSGNATLTLQNISFNGNNNNYYGRAIYVSSGGTLSILSDTRLRNCRQSVMGLSDNDDVKGGAVWMSDGTSLTINGGASRSVLFSGNEAINVRADATSGAGADGGAIAIGKNCTANISNAQFIGNIARGSVSNSGNGGAICVNETSNEENAAVLNLTNAVFRNNSATYHGGAVRTSEKCNINANSCIFTDNTTVNGDGGAISLLSKNGKPSTLTISGGTYTGNGTTNGNGGAIKIGGYGTLAINETPLISQNSAKTGGAVYLAAGAQMTMPGGTVTNNTAETGGAVYVGADAKMTMTSGTVTGNTASTGAGIYLAQNSTLRLSGNPNFGGADINATGGNYSSIPAASGLTNGKQAYTKLRQDIYIAGYENSSDNEDTSAASLVVTSNITSGKGTIWVWAERTPHYKTFSQFAKYEAGVSNTSGSFAAFRNARADSETGVETSGEFLYGVTKEEDTGRNVFWSGIIKTRDVTLRKVDQNINPIVNSGAVFTIYKYKNNTKGAVAKGINTNGTQVNLQNLSASATDGVFFKGKLEHGTYLVVETTVPEGYRAYKENNTNEFILTVNDDGAGYLKSATDTPNRDIAPEGSNFTPSGSGGSGGSSTQPNVIKRLTISKTNGKVGETATLSVVYTIDGVAQSLAGITYTSSNPNVATVDNDGTVHFIAAGSSTISAAIGNTSIGSVYVTVTQESSGEQEITDDNWSFMISEGTAPYHIGDKIKFSIKLNNQEYLYAFDIREGNSAINDKGNPYELINAGDITFNATNPGVIWINNTSYPANAFNLSLTISVSKPKIMVSISNPLDLDEGDSITAAIDTGTKLTLTQDNPSGTFEVNDLNSHTITYTVSDKYNSIAASVAVGGESVPISVTKKSDTVYHLVVNGKTYNIPFEQYDNSGKVTKGKLYKSGDNYYYAVNDYDDQWNSDMHNRIYQSGKAGLITNTFVAEDKFNSGNQCPDKIDNGTMFFYNGRLWTAGYYSGTWMFRPDINPSGWIEITGILSN